MKTVIIELSPETEANIEEIKRLSCFVNEKEFEANKSGEAINYNDFPEYTKLHNLYTTVRKQLSDSSVEILGIAL